MVVRAILIALVALIPCVASAADLKIQGRRTAGCDWIKAQTDIDFTLRDGAANRCVRFKMNPGGLNAVSAISQRNNAMDHQNFRRCIATGQVCKYLVQDLNPPWTPCQ